MLERGGGVLRSNIVLSPRQKICSRENGRGDSRVGRGFTPLLRAMPPPSTQVHAGKRR